MLKSAVTILNALPVLVLSSLQALLERVNFLFWLLVCSNVLLGLPRRSVHSIRLCHILVPGNVGPLVVGGGLCNRQLNVLWHSECMLAGCMCMYRARGKATKPVHNVVHHNEPGFSEPSCVPMVFCGLPVFGSLQLDYCSAASYGVELYTLCTYLHLCKFVVLFCGGVTDDRSVFKCWSNKGLITV